MECMFKFYLQRFKGVQCGFLMSHGRCPISKWFHPKAYENFCISSHNCFCYQCPKLIQTFRKRWKKNFVFKVSHTEKTRGVKTGNWGGQAIFPPGPIQATIMWLRYEDFYADLHVWNTIWRFEWKLEDEVQHMKHIWPNCYFYFRSYESRFLKKLI